MEDRELAQAREIGGAWEQRVLRRREFLQRTASVAGLAGMATLLPANALIAQAARAQRSALPGPSNMELDHVVILMMENRSYDHYFGWLPGADGVQDVTYRNAQGQDVPTRHFDQLAGDADFQGCGHPDPGHGWDAGRVQLQSGFIANGSGNDEFALTYYNEGELGFIHDAAKAYTIYDRFFCSLLGPTWPNRYYKWSAQSGGLKDNSPPVATLGNQWETIFDRALANNPTNLPLPNALRANYYASDLPFAAVWGPRAVPWCRPAAEFFVDCAAGLLPNISIIDPPFRDGGGFDGNSADEHPHGDVRLGQAFMADVVNAFVESPQYRRGALFVVYDEWGGFFDHVTPPKAPDNRMSANLDEDFGQRGFRIPAVAVSPWTRNSGGAARVASDVYGFESILKLISYRFGLGTLNLNGPNDPSVKNLRHETARNIGESFDWDHPVFEPPTLPDPEYIVSKPCTLGGGDILTQESAADHAGDLADLAGLAKRFGFPIYDSGPAQLFRKPDAVRRAFRPAGR
ncbi:MAG: phospholipase [Solirubrobacteraceae bacterium]|nr:phospholipase [Solirubrobacteraceae bacterium]